MPVNAGEGQASNAGPAPFISPVIPGRAQRGEGDPGGDGW